jgi:hypothetical protein
VTDQPLVIELLTPLTAEECDRRDALDKEMDATESGFLIYLRSLAEYRAKHLYRGTYPNFEAYLATRRKKYKRARAGQLIDHVQVIDVLSGVGIATLPENERQSRELKHIEDPQTMAATWLAAQVASGKDQPSGSWIKSAAETMQQVEVKDGMVPGISDDAEIPADADGVALETARTELERVQRMIDHIRGNRKTKPKAILIGTPTNQWTEGSGKHYLTICVETALPLSDFDKLYAGGPFRFVVYEIPPEVAKQAQP